MSCCQLRWDYGGMEEAVVKKKVYSKLLCRWNQPHGIAFDTTRQYLYVSDTYLNVICVIDHNIGKVVGTWGDKGRAEIHLRRPMGICLDEQTNRLYVADSSNDRVQVFDEEGKVVQFIGQSEDTSAGIFKTPLDVALTMDRLLVVADTGNDRIQLLTLTGEAIWIVGTSGDSLDSFRNPSSIAYSRQWREIYIYDHGNARIQVLNEKGHFQRVIFQAMGADIPLTDLKSIFINSSTNHLAICDQNNHRVTIATLFGRVIKHINLPKQGKPSGVAYNDAEIIVSDSFHSQVSFFPTFSKREAGNLEEMPVEQFFEMISYLEYRDLLHCRLSNKMFHSICTKYRLEWKLSPFTPGQHSICREGKVNVKATGLKRVQEGFAKWGNFINKTTRGIQRGLMPFDPEFKMAIVSQYGSKYMHQQEDNLKILFTFFAKPHQECLAPVIDEAAFVEICTCLEEIRLEFRCWRHHVAFKSQNKQPRSIDSSLTQLELHEKVQIKQLDSLAKKLLKMF